MATPVLLVQDVEGNNRPAVSTDSITVPGPLGQNGVVAPARAAAITTPNVQTAAYVQADVVSLKTAIDAIRVALQNAGVTL